MPTNAPGNMYKNVYKRTFSLTELFILKKLEIHVLVEDMIQKNPMFGAIMNKPAINTQAHRSLCEHTSSISLE